MGKQSTGRKVRRAITRKSRGKTGEVPGALPQLATAQPSTMTLTVYDGETIHAVTAATLADVSAARHGPKRLWLDVVGITDAEIVRQLGMLFAIDDLALEDVMTFHHRPKAEDLKACTFVLTHMVDAASSGGREQFSLFFADDFVVTFQERAGDCLGPVRQRMETVNGRIRAGKGDYLAYVILDTITDHYFPLVEAISDRLDVLESDILLACDPKQVETVHDVRRELLSLKRSLWPMREMLSVLRRDDNPRVSEQTRFYLSDTQDHVLQLIDLTETLREFASGLMDLYLNSISNRMNETMRVLTVISTIFIPLSFITGLWGMNFTHMALIDQPWGFPAVMILMSAIAAGLLIWFRHKRWI